jgi:hypothetical protein
MKNLLLMSPAEAGSSMGSNIFMLLVGLAFIVIVFILLREFFLWYWKITSIEKLLKEQNEILKEIRDKGSDPKTN